MSIIVGSARIGENNSVYGGKDGDQTRKEVSTQPFYVHSKGWCVLRAKSAKHAKKLAQAMQIACDNDNIGYNQLERYDVVKAGIETKTKVNADCSALVRACIKWATGTDVGDFRTVNEVDTLVKSSLFDKVKYTKPEALYNGDILCTLTSGHTVIVVSGATERKEAPKVAKHTIKYGSKGDNVKLLQQDLNYLKITDRNGKKLKVDGLAEQCTISAVKKFQTKYKLKVDGIYGTKTHAKMKELLTTK